MRKGSICELLKLLSFLMSFRNMHRRHLNLGSYTRLSCWLPYKLSSWNYFIDDRYMLEGNALWLLYASVFFPIVLVTRYLDVYTNLVKECPDYFHGDWLHCGHLCVVHRWCWVGIEVLFSHACIAYMSSVTRTFRFFLSSGVKSMIEAPPCTYSPAQPIRNEGSSNHGTSPQKKNPWNMHASIKPSK